MLIQQRSKLSSAPNVHCACALDDRLLGERCNRDDDSVHYVDCRHARCFDLVDDYEELGQVIDLSLASSRITLDRRPLYNRNGESPAGCCMPRQPEAVADMRPSTAPPSVSIFRCLRHTKRFLPRLQNKSILLESLT